MRYEEVIDDLIERGISLQIVDWRPGVRMNGGLSALSLQSELSAASMELAQEGGGILVVRLQQSFWYRAIRPDDALPEILDWVSGPVSDARAFPCSDGDLVLVEIEPFFAEEEEEEEEAPPPPPAPAPAPVPAAQPQIIFVMAPGMMPWMMPPMGVMPAMMPAMAPAMPAMSPAMPAMAHAMTPAMPAMSYRREWNRCSMAWRGLGPIPATEAPIPLPPIFCSLMISALISFALISPAVPAMTPTMRAPMSAMPPVAPAARLLPRAVHRVARPAPVIAPPPPTRPALPMSHPLPEASRTPRLPRSVFDTAHLEAELERQDRAALQGDEVVVQPAQVPALPAHLTPAREAAGREQEVLALLRGQSRTTREMLERLGWSRSTLRDVLTRLVQSGRVVRSAENPRSPEQSYGLA